ncbi:Panacea domain-containing protein [Mesorhizobium sp. M0199]|uniref:Panacea domain-containing protein n=1 Tax=unclassified Mesorhizobium TaxID=325217 RepID=UPI003339D283
MKHLFHYVIWAAGSRAGFGATKLYKVAWFSDARRFVLTGQSITGAPYLREKHGPIPRDGIIVRNELAKERAIEQWRGTGEEWVFKALIPPARNVFHPDEIKEIDRWIKEIDGKHTATSVSEYSHDYGWEIAAMKEPLPFHSILAGRGREPTDVEAARLRNRAKELGLL